MIIRIVSVCILFDGEAELPWECDSPILFTTCRTPNEMPLLLFSISLRNSSWPILTLSLSRALLTVLRRLFRARRLQYTDRPIVTTICKEKKGFAIQDTLSPTEFDVPIERKPHIQTKFETFLIKHFQLDTCALIYFVRSIR